MLSAITAARERSTTSMGTERGRSKPAIFKVVRSGETVRPLFGSANDGSGSCARKSVGYRGRSTCDRSARYCGRSPMGQSYAPFPRRGRQRSPHELETIDQPWPSNASALGCSGSSLATARPCLWPGLARERLTRRHGADTPTLLRRGWNWIDREGGNRLRFVAQDQMKRRVRSWDGS